MKRFSCPAAALVAAIVLSWLSASRVAAAEFDDLAARLPPGANAVVVVNAEKMFASPLAQRNDWQRKFADAFEATPFILPPSAQRAVIGARVNRHSLQPEWQAAVLQLDVDPDLAEVAKNAGGEVKQLPAGQAVLLPRGVWVAKFAPHEFGILTGANEDMAGRWLAQSPSAANLPDYLRESVAYAATAGTEIILALNLTGVVEEANVRKALEVSTILQNVPVDQAARILASVRGVKFGVRVDDAMNGSLRIDFAEPAAPLAPVAKPLVLAIVRRAGAMLDEFPQWTATVEGNHLALVGDLTNDGMGRIFSLLHLDAAVVQRPSPYESVQPPTPKEATARASLRYFRAVSKYVEGAQRLGRADSVQQAIMWLENFARRVQNLPTRNVDPELIDYGHYVAQTFQSVTDLAYGVERKLDDLAAKEQAAVQYRIGLLPTANTINYGGYRMRKYAPYGFAQLDPQARQAALQARQRTEEEIYQAEQSARDAIAKLARDHETVRQNLTERYGRKF